jgi:hypothetical protein
VDEAFVYAANSPTPKPEDALVMSFTEGPRILPRQLASCPLYDSEHPIA